MSRLAGTRLGPYEILSPLGTGGMGEVYRARDGRLNRTVAIKVLPDESAADADRRARFEREAKAISALDHPNICALYDVGEHEGTYFLVMPCLEGQTLADRIAKGALPVDQAIKIAIEIATALDAAHRHGIVHRDLKPGNVMLTKTGVKLLDFGLAKLKNNPGPMGNTTIASGTGIGTLLGTMPYMAPEQVEGREVDARSDIFALGAVIYEMVTGQRAFKGESPASVIGAILKDQPAPIKTLQPLAPGTLDHVVTTCLSKDPDERWQSAADIARELKWVAQAGAEAVSAAGPRRRWTGIGVAAALGTMVGALAVWTIAPSRSRDTPDSPTIREVARLTHDPGFSEWPTWAPDGQLFAFASNRTGAFDIYVRRLDGGQGVNITNHPSDDVQPALSPDGNVIAFVSTRSSSSQLVKIGTFIGFDMRTYGGDIWLTSTFGGQARRIAENGNFPAWHPNGRKIIYVTGQEDHRTIAEVSSEGGPPQVVLPGDLSSWEIIRLSYSPDGNWITFETSDRELFVMPSGGGQPRLLLRGTSHAWDSRGSRIYFVNHPRAGGTRLEAASVQFASNGPQVGPTTLVGVSTAALKHLTLTTAGSTLLATGVEESLNLTRVPLSGDGAAVAGPEEELSSGQVRDRYPVVSFDSTRVAFSSNRLGQEHLWLLDLRTHQLERVELPAANGGWITQACWARDSRHLNVVQFQEDGTSVHSYLAVDGSATTHLRGPDPANSGQFACAVAPDGNHFVYSRVVKGFSQLFEFDVARRVDRQVTESPSDKYEATWSRDGQWIAFTANTGGGIHLWRIAATGGKEEQLTNGPDRMRHAFYSPDGRWLYVQPSHKNIHRMPADGGPLQKVTSFDEQGLFLEEPTISPDGRWLIYNRGRGGASLWMLTLGTP